MKNIILKTKHYLFSQTNNKELFFYSLVYSYVLGFIAHAFAFLNLNLCHDYLNEYNIDKFTTIKIGSGRFMQPIIRLLLGDVIVTPWLNGIIGLTMLGLAVYFTLKMFGFDNHITAFVISGIYVTNLTVSVCIGSYMHDFVGNSIGYFLAVFVAYSWGKMTQKFSAARFVFSVLLSTVVLGIYQGIIPVTVVLMMIFSVNEILNGQTTKPALLHLGTGACIISLGALLYFILLKLSFVLTKIKPAFGYATSYAEKNISAKQRVVGSYLNYIWHFFVPSHSIFSNSIEPFNASTVLLYTASIANIGILIFGIVILIKWILKGQNDVLSKSCAVTVIALISFISSIIYAVTCFSHMITRYSYYLWYVLVIVLFKWAKNHLHVNFYKVATTLSVLLATALLVYNVRISNEIYVKKDLETKATLSSMTRVLSEIEAQESYVFGVTPVAFVGKFPAVQSRIPHTEKYIPMQNGMEHSFSVSFPVAYQSYFSNVLQYPITLYDTDATNEIAQKDIVKSMPVFPAKGSVQTIDGVIVVKMGEP